jgi:hypothetical protein
MRIVRCRHPGDVEEGIDVAVYTRAPASAWAVAAELNRWYSRKLPLSEAFMGTGRARKSP